MQHQDDLSDLKILTIKINGVGKIDTKEVIRLFAEMSTRKKRLNNIYICTVGTGFIHLFFLFIIFYMILLFTYYHIILHNIIYVF